MVNKMSNGLAIIISIVIVILTIPIAVLSLFLIDGITDYIKQRREDKEEQKWEYLILKYESISLTAKIAILKEFKILDSYRSKEDYDTKLYIENLVNNGISVLKIHKVSYRKIRSKLVNLT